MRLLLIGLIGPLFCADSLDVTIDATHTLHKLNPMYMGCHSDSGFVHQVRGWSSQMIFGESFETPGNKTREGQSSYAWQTTVSAGLNASIQLDTTRPFAGQASQHIHTPPGQGTAGLANRGLGNEGFYLKQSHEYEGYFFAYSEKKVTLEVRLENYETGDVLASQRIEHEGTNYTQHKFRLAPRSGTECVGIDVGSDPDVHCTNNPGTAHVCIKCAGQFVVSLVAGSAPSDVNIDYVVLQPGQWGRLKGLNARLDVANTLQTMGVKAIRLGGSFCSVGSDTGGTHYQWQKWTGPVWTRPSVGAHWDSYRNDAYNLIGGWGPFEMIDYATAIGAEPIITTTDTSSPDEFADLVEYCWGNASTPMGNKRIADGHTEPYRLKYIELGNEQYNPKYVEQVAAMEKRAKAVGAEKLYYVFPANGGLKGDDLAKAAALGLGDQLVSDLHVGAGGALPVAKSLFKSHTAGGLTDDAAVNFETNAGTHHHGRALDEATDLNDFFSAGNQRMLARTASFCTGRAGHFDMFDQAISFFLPNMTWLQPPGHVHAMITRSWQPNALNVSQAQPSHLPTWTTIPDKALSCSGSEYLGSLGVKSAEDCLKGLKQNGHANYAVHRGDSTKQCYICSITARGDPESWPLTSLPGATSFEGKNVIAPISSSAQQSTDKKKIVARLVNHGSAVLPVKLHVNGWSPAAAIGETLKSNDLHAENTAAAVDRVAPQPVSTTLQAGSVLVELPAYSYTTVTMSSGSEEGNFVV